MIAILGHLVLDPSDRDAFVEAHRDLLRRGRAFDGCRHLAITADPDDARRVNNAELWDSVDELEAWRAVANAPDTGTEVLEAHVVRLDATDGGPVF